MSRSHPNTHPFQRLHFEAQNITIWQGGEKKTPLCSPFGIAKLLTIRNEGFPVCRVATDWLTLLDTKTHANMNRDQEKERSRQ